MEFIDEIKRWLAKNNAIKSYKEYAKTGAIIDKLIQELNENEALSYFSPEYKERTDIIKGLLAKQKAYVDNGDYEKARSAVVNYTTGGLPHWQDFSRYYMDKKPLEEQKRLLPGIDIAKDYMNRTQKAYDMLDKVRDKMNARFGPTGIANPADYINNELNVGDNVPGYENSYVDGGVLSGMLTDRDDIRNATINWMKGLKGNDRTKLDNILNDKNFKDMYGDIDFELGKEETD